MDKVKKPYCYNCKFAGEQFKIRKLTHLHCEDPKEYTQEKHDNDEFTAWDTLRVFSSTCHAHEFKERREIYRVDNISEKLEIMKVGIKEIIYPKYVNELFAEISDEKKAMIVKSVIFQNVEEIDSDNERKYKISPFFQRMSNRVEKLPKKGVLESISLTESILRWEITEERNLSLYSAK